MMDILIMILMQYVKNAIIRAKLALRKNNIFIILMILTITIGSTTSLDIKQLKKVLHFGKANN